MIDLDDLLSQFRMLDSNKDLALSQQELVVFFRNLGVRISPSRLNKYMAAHKLFYAALVVEIMSEEEADDGNVMLVGEDWELVDEKFNPHTFRVESDGDDDDYQDSPKSVNEKRTIPKSPSVERKEKEGWLSKKLRTENQKRLSKLMEQELSEKYSLQDSGKCAKILRKNSETCGFGNQSAHPKSENSNLHPNLQLGNTPIAHTFSGLEIFRMFENRKVGRTWS